VRFELAPFNGQRRKFTATFVQLGLKACFKGRPPTWTVLLADIVDVESKRMISDHLWLNLTKRFEAVELDYQDRISFEARVTTYEKGYFGHREDVFKPFGVDYKLSYPTKFVRIEPQTDLELLRGQYERAQAQHEREEKLRQEEMERERRRARKERERLKMQERLLRYSSPEGLEVRDYISTNLRVDDSPSAKELVDALLDDRRKSYASLLGRMQHRLTNSSQLQSYIYRRGMVGL
jgi:hypothetical protein